MVMDVNGTFSSSSDYQHCEKSTLVTGKIPILSKLKPKFYGLGYDSLVQIKWSVFMFNEMFYCILRVC